VAHLVETQFCRPEGGGFYTRWCHCNVSLTLSFRPHYDRGVNTASDRNEYQQYFPGGGIMTTLRPSWAPTVLKSGSPNLLATSGPIHALIGIVLPLKFTSILHHLRKVWLNRELVVQIVSDLSVKKQNKSNNIILTAAYARWRFVWT
jgi:hypothetical protein